MELNLTGTESPYIFRWPDQDEEYEVCHHYEVVAGSDGVDAGKMSLAIGWRRSFGRNRRRILVFRSKTDVLVEFVGVDRWEESSEVIWQIKQRGSNRNVRGVKELPVEYRAFDIAPANTWITGPMARSGLAIRLPETNHEGMIQVALFREAHKRPRSAASECKRRGIRAKDQGANLNAPAVVPAANQGTQSDRQAVRDRLLELEATINPRRLFPTVVPEALPLIHEDPFAFALATCLDRGVRAEVIWTIPYDFKNRLGHLDPRSIAEMSESELSDVLQDLPRRPRYMDAAPRTIHELASTVVREFGGDASRIWTNRLAEDVKRTFESIYGVGTGIASMAVLLLEKGFGIRFDDLDHRTMDIKPDVHTVRVLHRLGVSSAITEPAAIEAARQLNPEYPGLVDAPLWELGRTHCRARAPKCDACPMGDMCAKIGIAH